MEKINTAEWVQKYGDILYSYAITRVYDEQLAKDLVQDTFLSALKAIDKFEQKSTLKTWLISIMKRKIIDYYRKKSTTHESPSDTIESMTGHESPFYEDGDLKGSWKKENAPVEWTVDTEKALEKKEFYKILRDCIALLPEKWAACFTLKVMEEATTEEICKEINLTPSNLWVILHRARLQLRECMGKNWLGE